MVLRHEVIIISTICSRLLRLIFNFLRVKVPYLLSYVAKYKHPRDKTAYKLVDYVDPRYLNRGSDYCILENSNLWAS